jgi:Type I phosphodiesterase / nucleotide pyrophosphatase
VTAARRWSVALGLVALAIAAMVLRSAFVQAFFADAPPGVAPALTPMGVGTPMLPASPRVRVLLLDGLSADHADALPNLGALCREGLDLRVDTGFPTVSLPVQHVLWTGRTQAQSGVWYRIPQLPAPPDDGLPRRVPKSVGVAESHAEIVRSFGFAQARPAPDDAEAEARGSAWRREGFTAAAIAAVASPARLVFVHVLRIDEAGHAQGAASTAYAEAAAWADARVPELRAAAGPATTWFVLADHGHRPAGGHGGAEAAIRSVRACVVGPGIAAADHRAQAPIHLVDLHRGLSESLGLVASSTSAGRSIAFALAHPDPGATLPQPAGGRLLAALALVLAGLAAAARGAGRRVWAWPWWLPVAYASIALGLGGPTLSHPMIYPRYASAMLLWSLPGAVVLALAAAASLRREGLAATLAAQGAPAVAGLFACVVACGGLAHALGLQATPPLVPGWTAHASLGFALVALGSLVLAAVVLAAGRVAPPAR